MEEKKNNSYKTYAFIEAELMRAMILHPDFPSDIFQQLAIMQEEAGEVTKAVLHYHYEGGSLEDIRKELIQTAAMCMRMLDGLSTKEQTEPPQRPGHLVRTPDKQIGRTYLDSKPVGNKVPVYLATSYGRHKDIPGEMVPIAFSEGALLYNPWELEKIGSII